MRKEHHYGGDVCCRAEVVCADQITDPVIDTLYLTPKTLQNGNRKTKVEVSGFRLDSLDIHFKAVSEDGKIIYNLAQTVSTEKNQGSAWLYFPDEAINAAKDIRYKVYASIDEGMVWSQVCADLLIRKPYDCSITENQDQQKMLRARLSYTEDRFGIFMHFNMGTFNDAEWVLPARDVKSFNPSELDCDQWVKAIASSGAKYAVLTTKHHDGFCLWDSKYTKYNIASSSTPNKDVLKDFTEACKKYDIKPVFYFSIWDRQRGIGGYDVRDITEEDMNYVKGQLTELLTQYGDITMIMFDGYGWGSSHASPSFMEIRELIRNLQPNCMVSDINGISTPWNMDVLFYEAPLGAYCPPDNYVTSHQGTLLQAAGWFWHPHSCVTRTAESVVEEISLLESRYCNFLLNVAPNNQGKFDDAVVATLDKIGELYQPDETREAIITPDISMLHPIQTKSATATSNAQDAWKVFDGYSDLGRYQQWVSTNNLPQSVTLDLGSVHDNINALTYVPTPRNLKGTPSNEDKDGLPGAITKYNVYVSVEGETFTEVVHEGLWDTTNQIKIATFASTAARYVKLEAVEAVGGYAAINELEAGSASIPAVSAEKPNLLNAITLNGKLIETFTIDDDVTRVDLAVGDDETVIGAIPMFKGVTFEVTQPTKESQHSVIKANYKSNGKTYERTYTIVFQPYDFELVCIAETASSSTDFVNDASKTTNRSGMIIDRAHPENSTHGTGAQYMWLSLPTDNAPWLRYDLGGVKKLDTMYIWNYNDTCHLNCGFRKVVIEYSVDGQTWTKILGDQADGSFEFAKATGKANLKATNLTNGKPVEFGGVEARYVRLTPDADPKEGTWGSENSYGLSEVLFVTQREKALM